MPSRPVGGDLDRAVDNGADNSHREPSRPDEASSSGDRSRESGRLALEDFEHQLKSLLHSAVVLAERAIEKRAGGSADNDLVQLRAVCLHALAVAQSGRLYAQLYRSESPAPRIVLMRRSEVEELVSEAVADAVVLRASGVEVVLRPSRDQTVQEQLLRVDRDFVVQIVHQLLDNAVKYSYRGGRVDVELAETSDGLRVAFHNHGIPMPTLDVEVLATRGWRGREAQQATADGSGIGLWIVANLIRSMGGTLDVATADGLTTVAFTIAARAGVAP